MPPLWEPAEANASIYGEVENHSEGMISFTYRPPSERDLEKLQDTQTYCVIQGDLPSQVISPNGKGTNQA